MKKVMLLMGFMVVVAFSFANESRTKANVLLIENVKSIVKEVPVHVLAETPQDFSCTVTFKATVGPSYASIEATCSATNESCDAATTMAANCITSAIRRGLAAIPIK
jgi:hypothetical protein